MTKKGLRLFVVPHCSVLYSAQFSQWHMVSVTGSCAIPMFKRRKTDAAMWINPRSNLNGGRHIAWDRRKTDVGNARYLELAEVALRPQTANAIETIASVASDDTDP